MAMNATLKNDTIINAICIVRAIVCDASVFANQTLLATKHKSKINNAEIQLNKCRLDICLTSVKMRSENDKIIFQLVSRKQGH